MPFYSDGDGEFMEQEKGKFEEKLTQEEWDKKRTRVQCYSRICGYLSPVSQWNGAKKAEFDDRETFKVKGE